MEAESDSRDGRTKPGTGELASPVATERRQMSSTEFSTMVAHFYRGEISRANVWRQRLDATFNWAVLTTGTTLSFAFGNTQAPHIVILINSLLIAVFLFIEARRYRYYELWSSRVRVIETDYIAPMLSFEARKSTPRDEWAEHLAEDLLRPHFTVGMWEAVGRRLRRNYIWVFLLLALSWNAKIAIHPTPAQDWDEFLRRAAIGKLSGAIVLAVGLIYNGLVFVIAFSTVNLQHSSGEVLTIRKFRFRPFRRARAARKRAREFDPDTSGTFRPIRRSPPPPSSSETSHHTESLRRRR